MTDIEYFELKKDFWIARWLQKPSNKEIKDGEKNIKGRGIKIEIGIAIPIIEKIINHHNRLAAHCNMYGRHSTDFDEIGSNLQLPRAIVLLVLESKGLLKSQPKRDGDKP